MPLFVRRFERLGRSAWRWEPRRSNANRSLCDDLGKSGPFNELQYEGLNVCRLFEPVDGGDVRMVESGEHPRLALESNQPIGIPCEDLRQYFDGDVALEFGITRPIHLAHTTDAEQRLDPVRAQSLAGGD